MDYGIYELPISVGSTGQKTTQQKAPENGGMTQRTGLCCGNPIRLIALGCLTQAQSYLRSLVTLLNASEPTALQFSTTSVWKGCGLTRPTSRCSIKTHFIRNDHSRSLVVL